MYADICIMIFKGLECFLVYSNETLQFGANENSIQKRTRIMWISVADLS